VANGGWFVEELVVPHYREGVRPRFRIDLEAADGGNTK
jgi:hypothetical protein